MKKTRTSALRIRLTPTEHGAVEAAGLAVGLGICSFARMATCRAAGLKAYPAPRRKPNADAIALGKWTTELTRISGLLNQLAESRDAGFDIDPTLIEDVRLELGKLRQAVLLSSQAPAG